MEHYNIYSFSLYLNINGVATAGAYFNSPLSSPKKLGLIVGPKVP
jgi:hypothetical protein